MGPPFPVPAARPREAREEGRAGAQVEAAAMPELQPVAVAVLPAAREQRALAEPL
jgi:hypothetical protein